MVTMEAMEEEVVVVRFDKTLVRTNVLLSKELMFVKIVVNVRNCSLEDRLSDVVW